MYADIKSGRRGDFDARDYYHNRVIDRLFKQAKARAWAKLAVNQMCRRVNREATCERNCTY